MFGSEYINHPRLKTLAEKNGITMLRALTGAQEAEAFKQKDYVGLHQSTLRKVDILHSIAERAYRRTLQTDASWWVRHGGRFRVVAMWVAENKSLIFVLTLLGVLLAIAGIVLVFHPPIHAARLETITAMLAHT
jgi:hypothetical protein